MPNLHTFEIQPIRELIYKYKFGKSIDPFANSSRVADITNDINPKHGAAYCMDALDFIKMWGTGAIDTVLFDPPYSPRQIAEGYRSAAMLVNQQTTQSSFWGNLKKEIARITSPGGIVITCGWNSGGIGKKLGFELQEVLLVPHGGWHNDTIVTVERRIGG